MAGVTTNLSTNKVYYVIQKDYGDVLHHGPFYTLADAKDKYRTVSMIHACCLIEKTSDGKIVMLEYYGLRLLHCFKEEFIKHAEKLDTTYAFL